MFYAGHGIEVDRRNFLVPVDARLLSDRRRGVRDGAARSAHAVRWKRTRGLRLIILDACRDNPFAAAMQTRLARRARSAGVSRVWSPRGETLVAYAAKEGTVAADGAGRNSPYTAGASGSP